MTKGAARAAPFAFALPVLLDRLDSRLGVLLHADLGTLREDLQLEVDVVARGAAEEDPRRAQEECSVAGAPRLHRHGRSLRLAGASRLDGRDSRHLERFD